LAIGAHKHDGMCSADAVEEYRGQVQDVVRDAAWGGRLPNNGSLSQYCRERRGTATIPLMLSSPIGSTRRVRRRIRARGTAARNGIHDVSDERIHGMEWLGGLFPRAYGESLYNQIGEDRADQSTFRSSRWNVRPPDYGMAEQGQQKKRQRSARVLS